MTLGINRVDTPTVGMRRSGIQQPYVTGSRMHAPLRDAHLSAGRLGVSGLLYAAVLLAVSACTSAPEPVWTGTPPETLVTQIRAERRFEGGQGLPAELDVQPLRDPAVEDLLARASRAEAAGRAQESAAALDQALALSPQDPALLQARAETAVLLRDLDSADRLAREAFAIGAQVGPLCRRHWLTVAVVAKERAAQRLAQAERSRRDAERSAFIDQATTQTGLATDAERRAEACMVTGPARY